jgi:hypothetical protein
MELPEAQALAAHGIKLAVVFQQNQRSAGDFTKAKGIAAGRRAFRHAHDNIGQPFGSGIYFGVDYDASRSDLADSIAPYFEGVHEAMLAESGGSGSYRIGAYGSGLTCSTLTNRDLIELSWLSMSPGFRGTREALEAGEYHLTQRRPESILCGLDIDYNDPNPNRPDFGAFTISDEEGPNGNTVIGERYKVIARNGLRLREGPGTSFDIIGGVSSGQIIFVVSKNDGWARVDVEGDGRVDGFAYAEFLEPI